MMARIEIEMFSNNKTTSSKNNMARTYSVTCDRMSVTFHSYLFLVIHKAA